jgi:hypothetical protein
VVVRIVDVDRVVVVVEPVIASVAFFSKIISSGFVH